MKSGEVIESADSEATVLLRLSKVSRYYGRTAALRAVDLELCAGESLFVLGSNGAGKSTLLGVLGGIHRPDEGAVVYRPGTAEAARRRRRETRYVPAGIGLYGDLTVEENLRIWAAAYAAPEAEGAVNEAVEKLRLERFRAKRLRECSTGVARRATLATAFLGSRQLLVLDEPLAHLDAESQELICVLLHGESERGVTLAVAAHEPFAAERLATRCVTVAEGRLQPELRS